MKYLVLVGMALLVGCGLDTPMTKAKVAYLCDSEGGPWNWGWVEGNYQVTCRTGRVIKLPREEWSELNHPDIAKHLDKIEGKITVK